ncbi:MAG: bifunctional DNA-formamidopyrimidine glycosylase/DNA-(apurinic or apyrimidinic site) lyase [Aeromicrobium sp.]|uniref:bifunctional DNA-formamidopyrimidine glycosylase/DNA-(apurinic or apyrimidinic site) lyase n=1 Tax=Aeromicrobium sp. TaxID=1871063 RepID=UPI0039E2C645
MPELPEVEVVRRGLEAHVVGSRIAAVEVLHPRLVRRHGAGAIDFVNQLVGRQFVGAKRRGKYLWLPLDNGDALMAHLGMSGQMLVQQAGQLDERHLRVRFSLGERELRFVDQRMFGGLSLSEGGAVLPAEMAHIAPDPMEPAFDPDVVVARIRRSSSGIKRLLLTQTVVSGVGNIYADEALWRVRLNGERPGNRLSRGTVLELLDHVRDVMTVALTQGGTSFDALYVNVNGQSGYFDRSLRAYGREGLPCERCGTLIRRVAFMNRSSYFCPTCQKPPRGR